MIVHVFNSGSVSGPEKLVLPALKQMQGLVHGQITVVFLEEERLGEMAVRATEYAESLGLSVRTVRVKERLCREAAEELGTILRDLDADIVHAHDVKATLYALWSRFFGEIRYPVLSTHHGVKGRPDLKTKIYERIYRFLLLPFCDAIFAVSSKDFKTLSAYPLIAGKTHLHLNGIAPPIPEEQLSKSEARKIWGESQEQVVLGWIGRLSKEKRSDFLIEVVRELRTSWGRSLPNFKVLLFGEGEERVSTQQLIEQYGIEDAVELKGFNPDIAQQYKGFDIVLNTSSHEGLSITLLEGAFSGCALCVTDTGGASDIIPADTFGMRVPLKATPAQFAAQLAEMIASDALRTQVGQGVSRRAQSRFTRERWVRELLDVYERFFLLRNSRALPCIRY